MTDYTPTTEEVRAAFRKGSKLGWHSRRGRLFDRWLAEVKAQAWEEGYTYGLTDMASSMTPNPYRQGEGSENSNSQPTAEMLAYLNRQGETNA